ncbi:hypothetical protein [Nonomuraea zeae]|uniref:Uncharacterized protein n=1 Tax=Nonomuraea zeae TaxID=1642303 RepID=A0A5S4FLH4_9ACTN|nr:hypothetical protein [Nonomuraea zeae]TMR21304.1 hypothetical protein ETD85_51095 [Nonomuraea zeae]
MTTPTAEAADLAIASGLPDDHPITALPGLTFHVTNPLKDAAPPILTVGDLKDWTDAALVQLPGFRKTRLEKVKTALIAASSIP